LGERKGKGGGVQNLFLDPDHFAVVTSLLIDNNISKRRGLVGLNAKLNLWI